MNRAVENMEPLDYLYRWLLSQGVERGEANKMMIAHMEMMRIA